MGMIIPFEPWSNVGVWGFCRGSMVFSTKRRVITWTIILGTLDLGGPGTDLSQSFEHSSFGLASSAKACSQAQKCGPPPYHSLTWNSWSLIEPSTTPWRLHRPAPRERDCKHQIVGFNQETAQPPTPNGQSIPMDPPPPSKEGCP